MTGEVNTLFLRLAGVMQSWGTSSRFQVRRTDAYPSKSGVLGLLLCAMGVSREHSKEEIERLKTLRMGVRVDRSGVLDWDYHTAGAKIGIMKANRKGIKLTDKTKEIETLLSRRQYLYDASFLVALHGDTDPISCCAQALENPVWPVFLGRKCCVPSEPVFAGRGIFNNLEDALTSIPWRPRITEIDSPNRTSTITLETYTEHVPGTPPPNGARMVYDAPRKFGYYNHGARWVVPGKITVPIGPATIPFRLKPYKLLLDYNSPQWKEARKERMKHDGGLCVFCKSPAIDVHHVSYENVGNEHNEDLRSLCKICHDACTMLEYGQDMKTHRVDPSDPQQRLVILKQVERLLTERRLGSRRRILESVRIASGQSFDEVPDSWAKEDS